MSRPRPVLASIWVLFLAGPVIWTLHFFAVYLLAEAVCATGGFDARVAGLRILSFLTVAATVAAVGAIAFFAQRAWRRWRHPPVATATATGAVAARPSASADQRESETVLALGGVLLGALFLVAVLFVGLPAFFLQSC
ncbi:MAG: hypothetical protein ACRDYF_02740 [Acidimicrobiia bacterium]